MVDHIKCISKRFKHKQIFANVAVLDIKHDDKVIGIIYSENIVYLQFIDATSVKTIRPQTN